MKIIVRFLIILSLSALCVACGGGGDSSPPPTVTPPTPTVTDLVWDNGNWDELNWQ